MVAAIVIYRGRNSAWSRPIKKAHEHGRDVADQEKHAISCPYFSPLVVFFFSYVSPTVSKLTFSHKPSRRESSLPNQLHFRQICRGQIWILIGLVWTQAQLYGYWGDIIVRLSLNHMQQVKEKEFPKRSCLGKK